MNSPSNLSRERHGPGQGEQSKRTQESIEKEEGLLAEPAGARRPRSKCTYTKKRLKRGPSHPHSRGGQGPGGVGKRTPHRSSGEKQAVRAVRGPARRCCPSVRTAGLVGWTPRPAPMSTRPPRGTEQDGEQAGLRARGRAGGGQGRPSIAQVPAPPGAASSSWGGRGGGLGSQGHSEGRGSSSSQGAVSPMLSPPWLLRALLQTVPSLPIKSNGHLVTPPLASEPGLPRAQLWD